jgi:ketosteroid isomerase-like protein
VIVRYYDAYNAGDIDAVGELLDEDVSYWDTIYEVR